MNFNRSKLLGGVLIIVALCAGAFMLFGGGFGGNNRDVPVTGRENPRADQGRLGNVFAAQSVNAQGCPVQETTRFNSRDSIIVGFRESDIPSGTTMFARLSQNGQPIEDTNEITADRDIRSCVWFEFASTGQSTGFEAGNYEAELFVNGNRAGRINLQVSGSGGAALPGRQGSNLGSVQLGQAYTTSQVDQRGCPTDNANSFYADTPIYVAFEESFIPQGTEVFARLNYQGDPVEDTDVIIADRDLQSCFWFVFEPDRAGFNSGDYSIDIFVNGGRQETLPLEVR
jgi:hypothetical protein